MAIEPYTKTIWSEWNCVSNRMEMSMRIMSSKCQRKELQVLEHSYKEVWLQYFFHMALATFHKNLDAKGEDKLMF